MRIEFRMGYAQPDGTANTRSLATFDSNNKSLVIPMGYILEQVADCIHHSLEGQLGLYIYMDEEIDKLHKEIGDLNEKVDYAACDGTVCG